MSATRQLGEVLEAARRAHDIDALFRSDSAEPDDSAPGGPRKVVKLRS